MGRGRVWVSPDLSERSTSTLFLFLFDGKVNPRFLLMITAAGDVVISLEAG
jgi:hypothetical protein